MLDGRYEVLFKANGYCGKGAAEVANLRLSGHDGVFAFAGGISHTLGLVQSSLTIVLVNETPGRPQLPNDFTAELQGSIDDTGFVLRGVGPLGAVVEIAARKVAC